MGQDVSTFLNVFHILKELCLTCAWYPLPHLWLACLALNKVNKIASKVLGTPLHVKKPFFIMCIILLTEFTNTPRKPFWLRLDPFTWFLLTIRLLICRKPSDRERDITASVTLTEQRPSRAVPIRNQTEFKQHNSWTLEANFDFLFPLY